VTTLADATFQAPDIDYGKLSPLLIVFGIALVGVVVEAFVPRAQRYAVQVGLVVIGLVASMAAVVWVARDATPHNGGSSLGSIEAMGALAIDGPSLFIWGTLLVFSLISLLLFAERRLEGGITAFAGQASALPGTDAEREASAQGIEHTEVFPLAMFAVAGMLIFPAANDLLTMFVALEVLSLPLYLLCGLARRRRLLSQEAAMKYFLLGAFSSAFFLYGTALLYGYAASVQLSEIALAVNQNIGKDGLLLGGTALLVVGLLFKVSASPFHVWTPDVYQGAPTPVTGFMAACTKVAAFGALLRVLYVALPGSRWDWLPALAIVAALTMAIGSVIAVVQADVKRMLAYSSIAHAGFILVGLLALSRQGISGVLFYLIAYGFTTIGAFTLITLVRARTADGGIGGEATHLSQWAGLGRTSPWVAATFTLFLLAFAGIPLTSGFTGKFAVFSAAIDSGGSTGAWLVVIGVVASAVAAFFYVRVIVLMYFSEPTAAAATVATPGTLTTIAIAAGAAVTVLLGVLPTPVLDLAGKATVFIP
jgi:NADH-quinone oxidoreductase subunit N